MNIKEVKDLIHEILQSDISEFELEHTGTRVKLRRGQGSESAGETVPFRSRPAPISPPESRSAPQISLSTPAESEEDGLHVITSPIVGTFYRAPSPGAEAFVKVGDVVEEGRVLCIVEAMKLMNEIPSDASGEIVRIYVENGHPVEFGQKLFGLRPKK